MKKYILIITLLLIGSSCKNEIIKEPKIRIERDQMVEIIYDLAVLEALKSQTMGQQTNYPKPFELIKEKYKVDSLTFVQNTQFYASNLEEYKKIYNDVKKKLDVESAKLNNGSEIAPENIE
jgi:hypothetical protein